MFVFSNYKDTRPILLVYEMSMKLNLNSLFFKGKKIYSFWADFIKKLPQGWLWFIINLNAG